MTAIVGVVAGVGGIVAGYLVRLFLGKHSAGAAGHMPRWPLTAIAPSLPSKVVTPASH